MYSISMVCTIHDPVDRKQRLSQAFEFFEAEDAVNGKDRSPTDPVTLMGNLGEFYMDLAEQHRETYELYRWYLWRSVYIFRLELQLKQKLTDQEH